MHALLLSALLATSAPYHITALMLGTTGPQDYSPSPVWFVPTEGAMKPTPGHLQRLSAAKFATAVRFSASSQCNPKEVPGYHSMVIESYEGDRLAGNCYLSRQQACSFLDKAGARTANDATMHYYFKHPEATDGAAHDVYTMLECGRPATN